MGMRFRKSIKIAPGVKFNVGKKSVGLSVGGKYGGVSVNSKTGARVRASAPGTGISYSEKIGKSSASSSSGQGSTGSEREPDDDTPIKEQSPLEKEEAKIQRLECCLTRFRIILPILCVALFFMAIVYPILIVVTIGLCVWWAKWRKKATHDLAVAKYRANCLKYDLKMDDPPTYEDISPYRIEDTYVDKKHRTKKKKQFYQRWWFILWALFCIWGAVDARNTDTTEQPEEPQQTQIEAAQSEEDSSAAESAASVEPEPEPTPEPETTPEPEPEPEPTPEPEPEPSTSNTAAAAAAPVEETPAETTPQSRTVYVTSTGKRYHYKKNCGSGTYYESTLDDAIRSGLTPCKKCVG